MIRFILKNTYSALGTVKETIFTRVENLPEIEELLRKGEGENSTSGREFNSLIGVEVFDPESLNVDDPCLFCPMKKTCLTKHTDIRNQCNAYTNYTEAKKKNE